MPLTIETSRGRVTALATTLATALEQRPFTERHPGRGVFINVEIDGDHYPPDPDELHRLAAALDHHAQQLRVLGNELATLVQLSMTFRAFSKRSPVNLFPVGRSHLSQDAMRRTGDTFLPAPALPSEPATETRDRRAAHARRRGRTQYKQKPQVTASES